MEKRVFSGTIVVVPIVIIIGVAIGVLLVGFGDQWNTTTTSPFDSTKLTAKNLKNGGSPVMGDPLAPITIIEYGDYQCTFCYRFHQTTLKTLQSQYIDTGKVNLIFKDFALNGPDSVLAAQAAHCAKDQEKYWQYHDEIYNNWEGERTGWVTKDDAITRFAANTDLNLEQFSRCINEQKYHQVVLDTYKAAQKIGIDATPTFLVFNDKEIIKIVGNQPLEVFIKTIDML